MASIYQFKSLLPLPLNLPNGATPPTENKKKTGYQPISSSVDLRTSNSGIQMEPVDLTTSMKRPLSSKKSNLKLNAKGNLLLNNNCINLSGTSNGMHTESNNAMDLTVSKKLCLGGSTSSSLSEPSIPGSPSSSVGSNSSSRESSPRTSSSALGEIPHKLTFDQLLALEQLKQQHVTQQKPNIVPTLGASLNSQLSSQATSSSAAAAAMLTSLLPPPLRSQFAAAIRLAANSSSQHYDTTNDISSQVLAKVAASLQETDFSSQFAKFAACAISQSSTAS